MCAEASCCPTLAAPTDATIFHVPSPLSQRAPRLHSSHAHRPVPTPPQAQHHEALTTIARTVTDVPFGIVHDDSSGGGGPDIAAEYGVTAPAVVVIQKQVGIPRVVVNPVGSASARAPCVLAAVSCVLLPWVVSSFASGSFNLCV